MEKIMSSIFFFKYRGGGGEMMKNIYLFMYEKEHAS